MLANISRQLFTLLQYLFISLLIITVSRVLLYFFNVDYFQELNIGELLNIVWQGLRFDLSALAIYQIPFVIVYFIPFPERILSLKKQILITLFTLSNIVLAFLNAVDSIYYRFTLKRSTADLFSFVATGDDTLRLIPRFIMDYWYVLLLVLILLTISTRAIYNRMATLNSSDFSLKSNLNNLLALLIFAGLIVLAIRGGIQLKPIRTIQAAEAVGVEYAALVLNTPFTIMKTINKKSLQEKKYFNEEDLRSLFVPIVSYPGNNDGFEKKNVVLIILESFSKEYMGPPFGIENKTPFLDSLAKESLFFNNTFANGKKSIEGIPAILAGIPSLMDDPYITSVYSNNQIKTLASVLKDKDYHTSFFHGGKTGTMGFDAFAKLAGFEAYYGMEDFPDQDGYDGNWGIYDEEFFQFFIEVLEGEPTPFFATFFSLSSHHPYKIPQRYADMYKDSKHPLLNTIEYADMALKKFFESAQSSPWFDNTVFIITADHTGQALNPSYATQLGSFAIPLLFYSPSDNMLKGINETVVQHLDIYPSVLGYLGHKDPVFSYGRNFFSSERQKSPYAVNYLNNVYQYVEDDFVLHFNGDKTIGLYNYKVDSLMNNNLMRDAAFLKQIEEMEERSKAIVQTYNNALIHNKQSISQFDKKE